MDKLKEKAINIIFDLITNIPDSLHVSAIDPENRANMLTQQAAFKAAPSAPPSRSRPVSRAF